MNKLCTTNVQIVNKRRRSTRRRKLSTFVHTESTTFTEPNNLATCCANWLFENIPSYLATY